MNTGTKKYNMATFLGVSLLGIVLMSGCVQELWKKPVTEQPIIEKPVIEQPITDRQPIEKSEDTDCSFSGEWDTKWGKMVLMQVGANVVGTYAHDGGKITGTIKDATLTGRWSEAPSYSEPNDAGDVEFQISEDCNSISGKWRYGSSGILSGDWTGERIDNTSPPDITPVTEKPIEKPVIEQPVIEQQAVEEKPIAQLIVGKWELAPNKRALTGSIVFNSNGNYELDEKFHDGTGVGTKGEYKLNSNVEPMQIDICAGICGQPGSEWTTRFGIIRVLSNGKLEIYTSPSDKHPSDFPDDTSGKYTMMLTRAE